MTDLKSTQSPAADASERPGLLQDAWNAKKRRELIEISELLFFAYRDFTNDPDTILADFRFGRAHHRVIHFVGRHPGISVAALLDILTITKQSLARVLKQLTRDGFVEQKIGPRDRRQRLLYLTQEGAALEHRLSAPQHARIFQALAGAEPGEQAAFRNILLRMTNNETRIKIMKLFATRHTP